MTNMNTLLRIPPRDPPFFPGPLIFHPVSVANSRLPMFRMAESITQSCPHRAKFVRSLTVAEETCPSRSPGANGFNRKVSRSRSKSTRRGALGSLSSLSFSQKQALASSWRMMRGQCNSIFRKILIELEIASPKVKQIFYKAALVDAFNKDEENIATMDAHIKIIVKFLDELLSQLDDEKECVEKLKRMGQAHAVLAKSCGFTGEIWERLGEIAMERICSHESVNTREAARAWRLFIACITDELRSGFDEEVRLYRKPSSNEQLEHSDEDVHSQLRQLRLDYESSVPYG